ncbi:MAG TPA: lysophospholipid acyltransferase family protein [Acidobacteriota bacterium]|nr:lysophospholipid acyltransferase family protein [Acidobacteriota bacterium]
MSGTLSDTILSLRPPSVKEVFFPALALNRKGMFWYAQRKVGRDSTIEFLERLEQADALRKQGRSLTFVCNHLSYADSHVIEVLMIRNGFADLAEHLIHIAGQKTFQLARRFMTRSLNTIRVYQPSAKVDKQVAKKMNTKALKWAAHLKRRGYSLLVFPEGTRSRTAHFNARGANPRASIYFYKSLVIPMALMGSEKIMPVGKLWPRAATVRLRVGNPIDPKMVERKIKERQPQMTEREFRQTLMLEIMTHINALLDPEYQDAENHLPQ